MTRIWWKRARPCGAAPDVRALPWREASYCVVDVETTGLDLVRDCIVSYGVVKIDEGRINQAACRYSLVKPECRITPQAVGVHTLREVDVCDAPSQEVAADDLIPLLESRVLVAHAAWIEQAFLGRLLRRADRRLGTIVLDTAALGRAAGRYPSTPGAEPSLESLATSLGLPVYTPHHALGDAMTTAVAFLALASHLSRGGSVSDLQRLSRDHSLG